MNRKILAFSIALLPWCVQAAGSQEVAQPAPDYHYECSLKEDFKPHGKVIGVLEIKKDYHADGKADATDAKLTFTSAEFLHDASPPMVDGYLRGLFITWGEDQHKELGVTLPKDGDRNAYISPGLTIMFGYDQIIKVPEKYRYDETIITIGKNKLVGKYKDGFDHFIDYYSPEVMNLERIEFSGEISNFRLEDLVRYANGSNEISFYFVKLNIGKDREYTTADRIVLRRFSLDPRDFEGIDRMYQDKILPWEKGIADYRNCTKVDDENNNDIVVTKGGQ